MYDDLRRIDPEAEKDFVCLIAAITNFVQNERVRAYNEGVDAEREACARLAENIFGGPAHTYASENADVYRAQDATCKRIAKAIRTREPTHD